MTSSHMVITEPVPDYLERIGWTGGECITDSRAMVNYFRTTPDGRIAFGWGGGPGRLRPGDRRPLRGRPARLERGRGPPAALLPGLEGRRIPLAWGGPVDVSPSHLPVAGSLDGPLHYGFGYTGNGVGPSRMVARSLASLALDRRDEAAALAFVEPEPLKVPPEPFRFVGGTVIRRALMRSEDAIDSRPPARAR